MNAHSIPIRIERADTALPILIVVGPTSVSIRAGTIIEIADKKHFFEDETLVVRPELIPGQDYGIRLDDAGLPVAEPIDGMAIGPNIFAGFHLAPTGKASPTERKGGNGIPAIDADSCWDNGFRPTCANPCGMARWLLNGKPFWFDIYPVGVDHLSDGTSRRGAIVVDGRDLPEKPGGGKFAKFDFAAAKALFEHHGKGLLGAEEFFAIAYGTTERASRDDDPVTAGSGDDWRFVGASGAIDITGSWWQWGTDGHPDDPRPAIFGGSWWSGGSAGSRYADLDYWPETSHEYISARGRSDHLMPA